MAIGCSQDFFIWRAPSSPHLACGLNGSFFLHFCGQLGAAKAGTLVRNSRTLKSCGTLRGEGRWPNGLGTGDGLFQERSRKKVIL